MLDISLSFRSVDVQDGVGPVDWKVNNDGQFRLDLVRRAPNPIPRSFCKTYIYSNGSHSLRAGLSGFNMHRNQPLGTKILWTSTDPKRREYET